MFPEYRDLITTLKGKDAHFDKLFEEHNKLDEKIKHLYDESAPDNTLIKLKKEKLQLKDELKHYLSSKVNNR